MNTSVLTKQWFELLAVLAGEVVVLALVLWASQKVKVSAGWRRTFCQAAIATLLLIFIFELTGYGRAFAGWNANLFRTEQRITNRVKPNAAQVSSREAVPPETSTRMVLQQETSRLAENTALSSFAPMAGARSDEPAILIKPPSAETSQLVSLFAVLWLAG